MSKSEIRGSELLDSWRKKCGDASVDNFLKALKVLNKRNYLADTMDISKKGNDICVYFSCSENQYFKIKKHFEFEGTTLHADIDDKYIVRGSGELSEIYKNLGWKEVYSKRRKNDT